MKIEVSLAARLEFLARVTDKECQHLLDTDGRLFSELFTVEDARNMASDALLEALDRVFCLVGLLRLVRLTTCAYVTGCAATACCNSL